MFCVAKARQSIGSHSRAKAWQITVRLRSGKAWNCIAGQRQGETELSRGIAKQGRTMQSVGKVRQDIARAAQSKDKQRQR